MVGTHRRVYIKDLLVYKVRRDRARRDVLGQMVQSELEAGLDTTLCLMISLVDDFSAVLDTSILLPIERNLKGPPFAFTGKV